MGGHPFPSLGCSTWRKQKAIYVHFIGRGCQWLLRERVQAITILHRAVVAIGEVSSFRFDDVLPDFSSISLHDLLCATGDGFRF
jgi:hypothetical protein